VGPVRLQVSPANSAVASQSTQEFTASGPAFFRGSPQNGSSAQHGEGGTTLDPWCSGWMTELIIDPMLQYQRISGDDRVDEIFIRLVRSLRDVGSTYFRGDELGDSFLNPKLCFDPGDTENPRILVPAYGAGLRIDGSRLVSGDYSDFEHCTDATALTATAIQALKHQGEFDLRGVGPFATEGDSFAAMHSQFAFYAGFYTFPNHGRFKRDPRNWTSADLAPGYSDGDPAAQEQFINDNKIGFVVHEASPLRKLSWWFNNSMLQLSLLDEAGVAFPQVSGGHVQPTGCH
jgi:hypothetical protein